MGATYTNNISFLERMYGVRVSSNGIIYIPGFVKIGQLAKEFKWTNSPS